LDCGIGDFAGQSAQCRSGFERRSARHAVSARWLDGSPSRTHIADGHLNSYTRFRLALTEQTPTIKPFEEAAWAELPDAKSGPIEPSLALTDALHRRWVMLLRSISDDDFKRTYRHPESSELTPIEHTLGYFAWHSRHHVAQIMSLRKRERW
jgi:hypothetical protein